MSDISIEIGLKRPTVVLAEVNFEEYEKLKDEYGSIYFVFVNSETKELEIGVPSYAKYCYSLSNIYNLKKAEIIRPMKCVASSYEEAIRNDKTVFALAVDGRRRVIASECLNKNVDLYEFVLETSKTDDLSTDSKRKIKK